MYLGYAIYYKDAEGFELPLFSRYFPNETVMITPNRKEAERWLELEKEFYTKELDMTPMVRETGWWLWKRKEIVNRKSIPAPTYMRYSRILATIFVKRVKLA